MHESLINKTLHFNEARLLKKYDSLMTQRSLCKKVIIKNLPGSSRNRSRLKGSVVKSLPVTVYLLPKDDRYFLLLPGDERNHT